MCFYLRVSAWLVNCTIFPNFTLPGTNLEVKCNSYHSLNNNEYYTTTVKTHDEILQSYYYPTNTVWNSPERKDTRLSRFLKSTPSKSIMNTLYSFSSKISDYHTQFPIIDVSYSTTSSEINCFVITLNK